MLDQTVHEFNRGATFEAVMSLPENVEENYFQDWFPLVQLRKEGDYSPEGLIADLEFRWLGPRQFIVSSNDTDNWAIGPAHFDILFTSRQGRRIRTKACRVKIMPGVTLD